MQMVRLAVDGAVDGDVGIEGDEDVAIAAGQIVPVGETVPGGGAVDGGHDVAPLRGQVIEGGGQLVVGDVGVQVVDHGGDEGVAFEQSLGDH